MHLYYQNQNVDIFKDSISVPGLVLKYMFQDLPDYFTLPTRRTRTCTSCTRTTSLEDQVSCFIGTMREM
jgi:hypothetical protein